MAEGRKAKLILVIGATGTGKTTWTIKKLKEAGTKHALLYASGMNIDDPVFRPFRTIEKLSAFKGGWNKISDVEIDYKPLMNKVIGSKEREYKDGFKNAAFIVDDAGEYETTEYVTPEVKKLARMKRHAALDMYYIFHGLTDVPIQLLKYTTDLVLFHTADEAYYKFRKLAKAAECIAAKKALAKMFAAGIQYQPIVIKLA